MAITNKERVGRALDILKEGLYPFVEGADLAKILLAKVISIFAYKTQKVIRTN